MQRTGESGLEVLRNHLARPPLIMTLGLTNNMVDSLPSWFRWILLLPVALAGGWVAGYGIYILNASEAARPDAPIVYIADFAGSFASNLVAFYLAHTVAPQFKPQVVEVLVITAVLASFWTAYSVVGHDDFFELIGIAGNLLGCILM